jgi:hypothetical protein
VRRRGDQSEPVLFGRDSAGRECEKRCREHGAGEMFHVLPPQFAPVTLTDVHAGRGSIKYRYFSEIKKKSIFL